MILFRDRKDAGKQLAGRLEAYRQQADLVVLGIPRGGVLVAAEIAGALGAPLDILVTHKLGAPDNPELAIGAVTSDGTTYIDYSILAELGLSPQSLDPIREKEMQEVLRRAEVFRRGRPALPLERKTILLVDDGIATGSTVTAALRALAKCDPVARILAVPVAPRHVATLLLRECERLITVASPDPFWAVGRFYADFSQVSDDEVIEALDSFGRLRASEG